jgi:hypothetical protein
VQSEGSFLASATPLNVRSIAQAIEREAGKSAPANGTGGTGGFPRWLERGKLSVHHRHLASHGDEEFAGTCANGSTGPKWSPQGNAIPFDLPHGEGKLPRVRAYWKLLSAPPPRFVHVLRLLSALRHPPLLCSISGGAADPPRRRKKTAIIPPAFV